MKIRDIRIIGQTLIKEIRGLGRSRDTKTAIGIGASGDKTFPIDKRAEEIILSGLEALAEPLTVISEESGVVDIKGGGVRVLVDPIDGSKNAVSGIPFYCTSMAIADGSTIADIKLSYIINLINGDEFWAERDSGAFLNGERIHAQESDEFHLIAYEAQSPGKDIREIIPLLSSSWKTRCLGATALDLSYLSSGAISVFISPSPSRSFDFAGGWLLVNEAGGVVTDIEGRGIENVLLGLRRSSPLLASGNRRLHEKALKLLPRKI